MASTRTQAVAARIPNALADRVRQQAAERGTTVSDVVGGCIRASLDACQATKRATARRPCHDDQYCTNPQHTNELDRRELFHAEDRT